MGGGGAALDPAQRAAQQRMLRGQRQHPNRRVPPGLGEKRRIQQAGQLSGRAREHRRVQHQRELPPALGARPRRQQRGAHRVAPACSRGLGTISTAARSRAGSGCR